MDGSEGYSKQQQTIVSEDDNWSYKRPTFQSLINQYGIVPPRLTLFQRTKIYLRNYYHGLSCLSILNAFLDSMPIIRCIKGYKIRQYLVGDVIAGITVAIVHIPQGKREKFTREHTSLSDHF